MMASFKIQELLDAADGKLIQKGNADFVSGSAQTAEPLGKANFSSLSEVIILMDMIM